MTEPQAFAQGLCHSKKAYDQQKKKSLPSASFIYAKHLMPRVAQE
jgi:hypothetical protein